MTSRVPPHDLEAEAAVLSAMLLSAAALDVVIPLLKPEHFYSEANRRICEAGFWLAEHAQPVDLVTVAGRLRDTQRLDQVGGSAYLAQLSDCVPAVAHIENYAEKVSEKATVRKLILACQTVLAQAYGDYGDPKVFLDGAEQAIFDLARQGRRSASEFAGPIIRRVFETVVAAAARGDRLTGHATGFERLDQKTAGLHDGDLTIIAARPGMGKTSLALNMAVQMALPKGEAAGLASLVISLEMPRDQLGARMACSEAGVDLGRLRRGDLQDNDWARLTAATQRIYDLPILIHDTPALTVLDVRAETRRYQSELERAGQRLGVVIVDYIQLMTGHGHNREQEISSISRGLKALAKELKVPVIALSQLNRAVETRGKDKRPQLSDLRESGAIEQDADNIIFIFREDYYDENSDKKGLAELIVAKQRNGPTGKVFVRWWDACARFDNLAPGEFTEEAA